jgi:hypothetical protein
VLHRPGLATTISITGDGPDPSLPGVVVTFVATVGAAPVAPDEGRVTFRASSGGSCIDDTPAAASATTATYSCGIAFDAVGATTVIAEYTGSTAFAYAGSSPEPHEVRGDPVFGDGFE